MANIIIEKETLNLSAEFTDGDTRTITLPNPKTNLTESQIDAIAPIMVKTLIGDKNSAKFLRWKTAKIVNDRTTIIDLNS